MRKLLFILVSGIPFFGNTQFSESFFEKLNPPLTALQQQKNAYPFYGIKTVDGTLGVRLADSLDTEVQWVKTDLSGNYQFYSGHLPSNSISLNERIINLFESGGHQYLVTNDSLSYAPAGIRIHKFTDYVENAGYFEFPTGFSWRNNQAYLQDGKIYVFLVNHVKQFKCLIIDAASLTLDSDLLLADNYNFTEASGSFSKSIHAHITGNGNMTVYANAQTKLARIKVSGTVVSPVEFHEMKLRKVVGIDIQNQKLICLKNQAGHDLIRYDLNAALPLSDIAATDSLSLPYTGPNSLKDWLYTTDGTTEFLASFNGHFKYLTIANNQITAQDSSYSQIKVLNLDLINGKPVAFGMRYDDFYSPNQGMNNIFLFATYGTVDQLFRFREYYGTYSFGTYNTRFGTGNALIMPVGLRATGDFIFEGLIYSLGQSFVGKEGEILRGHNSNFGQHYKPGPYTHPSKYSQAIIHKYNENFYVDLEMLNHHVASIASNDPNYEIPRGILHWPAHGNVSAGQAGDIAPFMDLNDNGIYEPETGEYPVFPGTRCLMNVTHQHESDFNGEGSGLELHTYMYNFDCADSISDVIFLKTEVFNRGTIDYDSLSSGLIADFDLGGPFDDYVATHVENGLIYAYNSDNFDDDYNSIPGFGDSLPTIGVLFLKGNKFPANSIDDMPGIGAFQTVNGMGFNDGIIDNEYKGLEFSKSYTSMGPIADSDPVLPMEWFNTLNGKNRFGDSLFYGQSQIPSRYSFPGNTDPLFYGTYGTDPGFSWTEEQAMQLPGDRRISGSFGSGPLAAGEHITYHSAVLAGKRSGQGQSQQDLFAKSKHIRAAFDRNLTSCGQTFGNTTQDQVTSLPEHKHELDIRVYPNPFSDEVYLVIPGTISYTDIQLYDINGKMILSETVTGTNHTIRTTELKNGIYFLNIQNAKGVATKKLIKQ